MRRRSRWASSGCATGGAGRPAQSPGAPDNQTFDVWKSGPHYCTVTIENDTLTCRALRPDGTVLDTFTVKDAGGAGGATGR